MDLHVPTPSSSDGLYDLADPDPAPAVPPAPADPEIAPPLPSPAAAPPPAAAAEPPPAPAEAAAAAKPKKKRKRRRRRYDAPSWVVSLAMHVAILAVLGVATLTPEVRKAVANINSALISGKGSEEEALHVLAAPTADRGDQAVGSEGAPVAGESSGGGAGVGGLGPRPPAAPPPGGAPRPGG